MARIEIFSGNIGGGGGGGNLQLSGGVGMTTTLVAVTDTSNVASPLKLSTTLVQTLSTLKITTADNPYIDAEDSSGNNRFTIGRDPSSQQVNLDFASNPTGSTTMVGAIRTYVNGSSLSEVLQFREDGTIFGQGTQSASNLVIQSDDDLTNLYIYSSACWSGLLTNTPSGNYNTTFNGRIIGTHGGTGNSALALGTIQADTSGSNFSIAMGAGCTITNTQNGLAIGRNASITSAGESTAIGYQATTSTVNGFALGNSSSLLQIGGNFTPTARIHVRGLGSTSATTSLLVQNSATATSLEVTDDQQVKGYNGTSLRFKLGYTSGGQGVSTRDGEFGIGYTDANNSSGLRFLAVGTGASYIDAWTEGSSKATNYPLFIGSRANNTGSATSGSTTQENGTQTIFGYAVNEASAQVTINSTTRGFLPPRMTNAQKNAITSPAEGLIVHDTTNNGVAYYNGSTWGYLSGAKQTLTGSGGTLNIPFRNGNIVDLALNSSTTLTFASHVVGTFIIQVTQGGAGSNTLTYPASVKWSGGTAPTLTTAVGKTDILTFYHDGTSFFGTYSLNY